MTGFVAESKAGDIVGIEVKASATPAGSDRRGLEKLRDSVGDSFKAGVIVYSDHQTIPLGDHLWAVPGSALWTTTPHTSFRPSRCRTADAVQD